MGIRLNVFLRVMTAQCVSLPTLHARTFFDSASGVSLFAAGISQLWNSVQVSLKQVIYIEGILVAFVLISSTQTSSFEYLFIPIFDTYLHFETLSN